MFRTILEQASWISQVVLVIAAIWAGVVAKKQVEAFKLFELLKFLQDEKFRTARRTVMRTIPTNNSTEWWSDPELEACASTCCGSYDILGRMIQRGVSKGTRGFFVEFWAESIVHTYSVLECFIQHRSDVGGPGYEGYIWLYQEARKHCPAVPGQWPPTKQ